MLKASLVLLAIVAGSIVGTIGARYSRYRQIQATERWRNEFPSVFTAGAENDPAFPAISAAGAMSAAGAESGPVFPAVSVAGAGNGPAAFLYSDEESLEQVIESHAWNSPTELGQRRKELVRRLQKDLREQRTRSGKQVHAAKELWISFERTSITRINNRLQELARDRALDGTDCSGCNLSPVSKTAVQ